MPVWTARWCWPFAHATQPWNTYVYFRRGVDLPARPRQAMVRVSADARYTLYVNGQRVHHGPARSFPEHQSFDTLDLVPFLRAGRNTICAICYQFGIPTFRSIYADMSGFLLDGVVKAAGKQIPLHTPEGWVCRIAQAWRKETARQSFQSGFQEHCDARQDPSDWMEPGYEANESDGWRTIGFTRPVGAHPWLYMEKRIVPLLAARVEPFAAIVAEFTGPCAADYETTQDVYHLLAGEPHSAGVGLLENREAMLRDDDEQTLVRAARGEFVMAVLDLGTYRTGHVMLDIADASGGEMIDIISTESLEPDGYPLLLGSPEHPSYCNEAFANRYICRSGAQQWEPFHYMGQQYVTLVFRNLSPERPLRIRRVAIRQTHAGFAPDRMGTFECSDPVLNRVWQTSRVTQLNCAFDSFVDCPTREQAQWWGDARIQARVTATAFGDTTLLARGIRQVAQSQASDGSLHAHPPALVGNTRLPDFMMTWVGTMHDLYRFTGRTDHIRVHLPAMHRLFEFFRAKEGKEGLIGNLDGFWVFLDWVSIHKGNYSGFLNMMYLQATRWAAELCRLARERKWARRYEQRAARLERLLDRYFWDAKRRMWLGGWDPSTRKPVNEISHHMHALAILLNLKPQTHQRIARDVLLARAQGADASIVEASIYYYAYVLEALFQVGLGQEAVSIIRRKWGAMLEQGAVSFWEGFDVSHQQSKCHAWASSPLYHLSERLLGVMPAAPGWKRVRIEPLVAEGIDFARGVVPTPMGMISVEWRRLRDGLSVRTHVPKAVRAEFVTPDGQRRRLSPGSNRFTIRAGAARTPRAVAAAAAVALA